MQRKHVSVLAGQNLVAGSDDEPEGLVREALACVVRDRRGFLQCSVRGDHLARNQIRADAEVLKRALRLGAPELVRWNLDLAQAVRFLAKV